MKITLTSEEYQTYKAAREKANEGCRVCPCCKHGLYKPFNFKSLTESYSDSYPLAEMFFGTQTFLKNYRIDLYRCDNCGAEWESEPYVCKN